MLWVIRVETRVNMRLSMLPNEFLQYKWSDWVGNAKGLKDKLKSHHHNQINCYLLVSFRFRSDEKFSRFEMHKADDCQPNNQPSNK